MVSERVADPKKHTQSGWTALMCAAHNGHAECVRLLVAAGADKNATDHVRDCDHTSFE